MTETLHRYPGAQPFSDNDFSRRTFFGRDQASIALTDQILANRLVIVYAKSGMGKTSLLNAGVAPRLRDAGYLPLFVRVNDIAHGPLLSVREGIREEAARQQVEYVEGEKTSLWSFFKSVEFWRGDLLQTPVLILDQFEELFTLQASEAREEFLSQLGSLVRGISPPPPPGVELNMSEAPPAIHVVLSLREDFLGVLEEASDRIPEIMDHRFRVPALSREMAAKAITGPAAIEDVNIAMKAFRLEPSFVESILDYLTRPNPGSQVRSGRYVEPFHLQLICQRIESVAAFKQQLTPEIVVLNFKDFGGEPALAQTLETFYAAAIGSLPARHLRGAARALCEQFLISPEGRRLSVEERELRRALKLPRETLDQLVDRRLLRTDRRSDRTYYELSHDTLVQPVLSSRRIPALALAWFGIVASSILILFSWITLAVFIIVGVVMLFSAKKDDRESAQIGLLFGSIFLFPICVFAVFWLRNSLRRRKRYSRHTERELARTLPTLLPFQDRVLGWTMLVTGPALLILWGFAGLYEIGIYGMGLITNSGSKLPEWLSWAEQDIRQAWAVLHHHPLVEMLWMVFEYSIIVLLGWLLLRNGARMLWPHRFSGGLKKVVVPGIDKAPSVVWASLHTIIGILALSGSILGLLTLRTCSSLLDRDLPGWLQGLNIVSQRLSNACNAIHAKSWDWNEITFAVFFVSVLVLAIVWLRQGFLSFRSVLRYRRMAPSS